MSFASFPINTLELKQQYATVCARAGLATAADVLLAAPADLAKKLRSTPGVPLQIPDLVQAVSKAIAPQVHTAASLLSPPASDGDEEREERESTVPAFISTGDATLDAMLGGGVRVGAITEITGESAAGKSHLTLSLAIAAQLPPPLPPPFDLEAEPLPIPPISGGTIILTSERILTTSRLVELAEGMSAGVLDPPPIVEVLDNIHTSRVVDIDALEHALAFAVPPMLVARRPERRSPLLGQQAAPPPAPRQDEPRRSHRGKKPIRLLIIDSITALLRGETERSSISLTQRSRYLCTIGDRLKALAVEYELAVVVVNQVKDVFAPGFGVGAPIISGLPGVTTLNGADNVTSLTRHPPPPSSQLSAVDLGLPPMAYATQARHFSGQSPGVAKEAALGIVWANTVNTRLMLARTGRRRMVTDDDLRGVKRARTQAHQPPQDPAERGEEKKLVRRIHLVFSAFAPPSMLDYVILSDGIRALPASFRLVDLGPAIRRRDLRLRAALDDGRSSPANGPNLTRMDDDEAPGPHLGSDVYDEMDIPPELWEGLDDDIEPPGSPLAVGVV